MINRKKKYISRLTLTAAITSILFSGCGAAQKELAQTDRASYEKISYQTVTVQSGSLTPQTTISLSAQGYTRFSYGATNTELTLEKVNVAVGDHVKKGDILVAFKSGEIQKKIEDYSGQISQNKLLAEHYRAIMKIDDTQDYSSDIAQLDKDTEVAQLYLDEAEEKLSRYQITASEDGTITAMNNSLLAGVFEPGSNLITEISGTLKSHLTRTLFPFTLISSTVFLFNMGVSLHISNCICRAVSLFLRHRGPYLKMQFIIFAHGKGLFLCRIFPPHSQKGSGP